MTSFLSFFFKVLFKISSDEAIISQKATINITDSQIILLQSSNLTMRRINIVLSSSILLNSIFINEFGNSLEFIVRLYIYLQIKQKTELHTFHG